MKWNTSGPLLEHVENGTRCPQSVHVHLVDLTIDFKHISTQYHQLLEVKPMKQVL